MNGLLNMGSLGAGLCAWAIPTAILLRGKISQRGVSKGIFLSFLFALLSLVMQIVNTKYLIERNDWTALMDTQGAVVFAAIVLVGVVVTLNGIVWFRLFNSSRK